MQGKVFELIPALQVYSEAERVCVAYPASNPGTSYWRRLNELDAAAASIIAASLVFHYGRLLRSFASSMRDGEWSDLEFVVSQQLVALSRLDAFSDFVTEDDEHRLPAVEAIANQLLSISQRNVVEFVILEHVAATFIWPAQAILEAVDAHGSFPQSERVRSFASTILQGQAKLKDALTDVQISTRVARQIAVQTMLMMEMGDRMVGDFLEITGKL